MEHQRKTVESHQIAGKWLNRQLPHHLIRPNGNNAQQPTDFDYPAPFEEPFSQVFLNKLVRSVALAPWGIDDETVDRGIAELETTGIGGTNPGGGGRLDVDCCRCWLDLDLALTKEQRVPKMN